MPQLPGARRARAHAHHGSHTPTSSRDKMAYHTKQIRRQCIIQFLGFKFLVYCVASGPWRMDHGSAGGYEANATMLKIISAIEGWGPSQIIISFPYGLGPLLAQFNDTDYSQQHLRLRLKLGSYYCIPSCITACLLQAKPNS